MRLNFLMGVIGAPRTGKSTFIKEFCKKYMVSQNKSVVWFSHSETETYPTGIIHVNTMLHDKETLKNMIESLRGCLIVVDDYLQGNLSEPDGKIIRNIAAFRGHLNNDIIIVSHSVNGLPPKVGGLIEHFVFFKPTDFKLDANKKPLILEDEFVFKKFKSLKKCNFAAGERLTKDKHYFICKSL